LQAKSATSRISSLYKFLWSIPIKGNLLNLSLFFSAVASFALVYANGFPEHSLIVITCFLLSNLSNILLEKFETDFGMLNLRRANQITIVNSWFLLFAILISLTPAGAIGFTVIIAAATFLRTVIYLTFAGKRIPSAIPLLISGMILEAVPAAILLSSSYGYGLLKAYIIGGGFAAILLLILERFILIKGVPALRYTSAILAVLLDGRTDWLKEIAEKLNDRTQVEINVITFRSKGREEPELAILVPTFHPGPFRNFGSSGLIYEIADELESLGIRAVFFKGLSNHETNVISPEDCRRILEGVKKAFSENVKALRYSSSMSKPVAINNGDMRGTTLALGEAKFVFLTRHPEGMEDIPPSVVRVKDEKLIPVDCHNSFSDNVKDLDDESLRNISKLLEKAADLDFQRRFPIVVGYSRVNLNKYSLEDGIGKLGITALIFNPGKPIALIVLDGNNCLPAVRDEILRKMKAIGVETGEVLTTDTHIVNGLKFGGRGYHPLGEVIPAGELAEEARKAVEEALKSAKPMETAFMKLKFEDVKVTSSEFFEEAANQASKGLKLFLTLLAASLILGALTQFFF